MRGRVELIAGVLRICRKPATRHQVIVKNNMSFDQFSQYSELLMEIGLLDKQGKRYETSETGIEFLQDYARLEQQIARCGF